MGSSEKVTFRVASWNMLAARDLAQIGDMNADDLRIFKDQITAGNWQLLEVLVYGERMGVVVHSVEHEGAKHALVINAAAVGAVAGIDVTAVLIRFYKQLARSCEAYALRCWTNRMGLVRKLERVGAARRYVMELELDQ